MAFIEITWNKLSFVEYIGCYVSYLQNELRAHNLDMKHNRPQLFYTRIVWERELYLQIIGSKL